VGQGNVSVSNEVVSQAEAATGRSKLDDLTVLVLEARGAFGYIFQRRWKVARGLGYVISYGVQVRYVMYTASRSSDQQAQPGDVDKLFLEFNRTDTLYGPFINVGIVF
jgi:hypothetical protein